MDQLKHGLVMDLKMILSLRNVELCFLVVFLMNKY
jgi:hypothetical protein